MRPAVDVFVCLCVHACRIQINTVEAKPVHWASKIELPIKLPCNQCTAQSNLLKVQLFILLFVTFRRWEKIIRRKFLPAAQSQGMKDDCLLLSPWTRFCLTHHIRFVVIIFNNCVRRLFTVQNMTNIFCRLQNSHSQGGQDPQCLSTIRLSL